MLVDRVVVLLSPPPGVLPPPRLLNRDQLSFFSLTINISHFDSRPRKNREDVAFEAILIPDLCKLCAPRVDLPRGLAGALPTRSKVHTTLLSSLHTYAPFLVLALVLKVDFMTDFIPNVDRRKRHSKICSLQPCLLA